MTRRVVSAVGVSLAVVFLPSPVWAETATPTVTETATVTATATPTASEVTVTTTAPAETVTVTSTASASPATQAVDASGLPLVSLSEPQFWVIVLGLALMVALGAAVLVVVIPR